MTADRKSLAVGPTTHQGALFACQSADFTVLTD
jgi:hypothetical protein